MSATSDMAPAATAGIKCVHGWWFPSAEVHLSAAVAESGHYQRAHRQQSLSWVRNFRTAVDIGGHVGLWSRDLAGLFSRVIAIEPLAIHRECFRRNVPAGNIELLPYAIGHRTGFTSMNYTPHNSGMTHIAGGQGGDVAMITLDSLGLTDIDYIKIDTEGYELHVLEGAAGTLLANKPIITIEQKANSEDLFQIPRYQASEFLVSLGARPLARVVDDIVFGWERY